MKFFKRKVDTLRNDEPVGCSWFSEKQLTSALFLRANRVNDNFKKQEHASLQNLSKGSNSSLTHSEHSNKLSLRRQKSKTSARPEIKPNKFFFQKQTQQIGNIPNPSCCPSNLSSKKFETLAKEKEESNSSPIWNKKLLGDSQNGKLLIFQCCSPKIQGVTQKIKCQKKTCAGLDQSMMRPYFEKQNFKNPLMSNISESNAIKFQKKYSMESMPTIQNSGQEWSALQNEDDYFSQVGRKENEENGSENSLIITSQINHDLGRSWFQGKYSEDSLLYSKQKSQANESIPNNIFTNGISLKRIKDMVETQSLADQNENNEAKQSVVLRRLSEYPSLKNLHSEEEAETATMTYTRGLFQSSTIRPCDYL